MPPVAPNQTQQKMIDDARRGAAVVVGWTLFITWREAQLAKAARQAKLTEDGAS